MSLLLLFGGSATTITGTLAKTNGNDTSVATGTVASNGSVARTNANDTGVATGVVAAAGVLARTNGNDTLAATGSASSAVVGTLTRVNGNDSATGVGAVSGIISGSAGFAKAQAVAARADARTQACIAQATMVTAAPEPSAQVAVAFAALFAWRAVATFNAPSIAVQLRAAAITQTTQTITSKGATTAPAARATMVAASSASGSAAPVPSATMKG